MSDLSKYVMPAIEWGLVPLILMGIFLFAVSLTPTDRAFKSSTTAGKFAGFILFVLFVVSQKGHSLTVSFTLPTYGIEFVPLLSSIVVFFWFAWLLDVILRTLLTGIVALVLVASSLVTLYAYLFLASYRSMIVFIALGGTLGLLLEELFFKRDRVAPKSE